MTRLAIVSDIHGNLQALDAVRSDIESERVDRVVVAGDSIHWGPSSAEVVDIIKCDDWTVIRGNNELYLLDFDTPRSPEAWGSSDYQSLRWLREQVRDEQRELIATWPDTLSLRFSDAPAVRVVHGSPRSHWEPMHRDTPAEELATMLAGIVEPFVIAGHTHMPMVRTIDRWTVYNPGSVGLPLDGEGASQYLLLDGDETGWRPTWRRIDYDRAPLFEAFERSEIMERCGPVGELIVEEFRTNRIHVQAFNTWRNQHHAGYLFTDALLREFRLADRWEYTESAYHVNRDVE
jgi:predicted phosphodiesterase